MGNHNRGGGGSNWGRRGGGFRNRNYHRSEGRGERQMFKAVCANCGNECEVPFRPTGDKPVYCRNCFEKMGGREERGSGGRRQAESKSLDSVNAKLDKILDLLQPKEAAKE